MPISISRKKKITLSIRIDGLLHGDKMMAQEGRIIVLDGSV